MNRLSSFLGNDTVFGRLMTRCGILIAANLLFVLFSIAFFTIGAAWTALYTVMFKTLRGDGELNPFQVFWRAFRDNFVQASALWLLLVLLGAFLWLEQFWCAQFSGFMALFRFPVTALLIAEAAMALYLFPTMAAFRATIPELAQDSVYFMVRRPVTLALMAFAHIAPVLITCFDLQRLPLYAFLWVLCGFSGIAMFSADLLLKQFNPLLNAAEPEHEEPTEEEILEDMKKLGM